MSDHTSDQSEAAAADGMTPMSAPCPSPVTATATTTRRRSPRLSNPHVNLPLQTLSEIPNILSDEEAADFIKALNGQYYRQWYPEGYDRQHRVQRYSSLDETDGSDGSSDSCADDEDGRVSMEKAFGWIFDRIVSHSDPEKTNLTLHRPFEIDVIQHTPSSCQSMVNTFEQNAFSPCRQEQKDKGPNVEQSPCNCYVAQLTLMNSAIQSIEKPLHRELECWDIAMPIEQHQTDIVMEKNGVTLKTGESLWDWRGRISNIHVKADDIDDVSDSLPQEMADLDFEKKHKKRHWKWNQKLKNSNERCIIVNFRGIQQPKPIETPKMSIAQEVKPSLPLSELLTIIVTTSPIRSHPSTEMLENTFDTFSYAGDEFAYECPKVIICDGCRIFDDNSSNDHEEKKDERHGPKITRKYANIKQTLRNGIATTDQADNYNEFKLRLRKLCKEANLPTETKHSFRNTEVVELEERNGYGFALRHALSHCVNTPYVCVIQHDRTFMRPTPMKEVVSAMDNDPQQKIKYVGVNMRSNILYHDIFSGKYGRRAINELKTMVLYPKELCIGGGVYGANGKSVQSMVMPKTEQHRKNQEALKDTYRGSHGYRAHVEWMQSAEGSERLQNADDFHQLSLTPTLFWYDNTHIVQTAHYRDFIFNPQYKMVARGGFVEEKLSPCMIRNCERLGLTAGHAKFGCYILNDHSGVVFTGHLDGGSYMTAELYHSKTDKYAAKMRRGCSESPSATS